MNKVFVYGTLKKGGRLNVHLEKSKFIEERTLDDYALYNVSWFPGIKKVEKGTGCVKGEVYEVNEHIMKTLDVVEGCPNLYTRKTLEDGTFVYVYNHEVNEECLIKEGVFNV